MIGIEIVAVFVVVELLFAFVVLLFVVDLLLLSFVCLGLLIHFSSHATSSYPAPKAADAHLPLMTCKIVNEINIFIEGSFHC